MEERKESRRQQQVPAQRRLPLQSLTLSDRARRWAAALVPPAAYVLLTIIAAWPVVTQLDGVIIGNDTDVYINLWADSWTLWALQDPQRAFWTTDLLFYPQGADLHYHSFSHLTTAVSLALRPFLGALPAYNVTILGHLVLAALAMYHFARYLTGSAGAAFLAGLIFAFNWHNQWQTCHPVLVSIWPLPWAALFLLQAVERLSYRRALVAAFFVLLASLNSTLILILAALWLGFILVLALATGRLTRAALPVLIVFGLAGATLAALPLLPLLREALLADNTTFVIGDSYSLPTDALAVIQPHWLGTLGRSLHFGVGGMLLLGAALFTLRRSWPWFLLLILTYLFAIGPQPMVGGETVDVTLPWSYAVRPLLRHTYRLNVILSGALAVLAAYGWLALAAGVARLPRLPADARRSLQWALALLLGVLIVAEYTHPPFPRRTPQVSAFYTEFLDDVPDDVALAILPTGRQEDKAYMYYQTLHGHPITGGVISRPTDDVFTLIRSNSLLRAGALNWSPVPLPPDAGPALRQLADVGVGYVVLDKANFAQSGLDLAQWRETMPGAPVYEDELVVVFSTGSFPVVEPAGAIAEFQSLR
ncbi:MAG: hypothetical protein ACOCXI_07785 [Chloroflexota bacterium]